MIYLVGRRKSERCFPELKKKFTFGGLKKKKVVTKDVGLKSGTKNSNRDFVPYRFYQGKNGKPESSKSKPNKKNKKKCDKRFQINERKKKKEIRFRLFF